jgi:hypothetical protein
MDQKLSEKSCTEAGRISKKKNKEVAIGWIWVVIFFGIWENVELLKPFASSSIWVKKN